MLYKAVGRGALRSLLSSSRAHRSRITTATTRIQSRAIRPTVSRSIPQRSFCSSPASCKGITPGSSDPAPPNPEPNYIGVKQVTEASYISEPEYRDRSEEYINALMAEIERTQEEQGSEVEAEYSAGVLNVVVPGIGTYVLNKQPPNKQIWLSSPISGPKRFDWVVQGDEMTEKEGTRDYIGGQWIYLRDGTNLTDILNAELNLELRAKIHE
ncbi:iron donor protein CyaY [Trichophyton rubrum D6]|uniref:ferroxidase n=5 Tax=Trichophyton TaxID=5550 RepID=A0A178F7N9_TRIRU|nr:ferroxidase [Trichophyton rubrum CBS 118892]EZF26296.1 iron donor protein CyaY [Trichophyton rubrum MR850]EZF45330.1 iron donor protein CyaY [Trichophyton rubrum CBS 100081]EZF55993.1 iron donor protein CyaY [Trichophyton rubrum CBS 288.86]EZF66578.1 iron donor protein CyaY [Trichophyton rubrum CBS 289.86]EZF77187.1 iron donor protein CyaY [Trichophyton soudanense CBS 452.61]EZF87876.1 iron donor protein CyaY [Trichophyton rubrum MR1448]EZF98659.1 iron donor protein CyaY [Trichophyton rub